MRRTITILAALGLVFAGACQRIDEGLVQEGSDVFDGEVLTVEASFGDSPDTKTAVQSDGKSIFWTPGDAINLFFGNISSAKFTTASSMTEPSATASFTGTLGADPKCNTPLTRESLKCNTPLVSQASILSE